MLKIDFTTSELNKIKEEVVFSDLQERIIELKRKEWSNTQICMELSISQSKLSKEIKKIAEKIANILDEDAKKNKVWIYFTKIVK